MEEGRIHRIGKVEVWDLKLKRTDEKREGSRNSELRREGKDDSFAYVPAVRFREEQSRANARAMRST
jgi:hypothetical protein